MKIFGHHLSFPSPAVRKNPVVRMLNIHIFLLSCLVFVCLAENTTKQSKPDSKHKSEIESTLNHKPAKEHLEPTAMTNSKASDADKIPGKPENDQPAKDKSEDMKSSSTIGLGFYAGVLPVGSRSYPGYPYYRSYYPRPYWGYSYRPVPFVYTQPVVRPRPIPLILG